MIKYSGNYRKGKAIGLPYQGSKKKISRKIVEIVKENFGENYKVYDLLGGGGAIACEFLLQGFNVVYNEKNKSVYEMFKRSLTLTNEDIRKLIISRDEFLRIRDKEVKTVEDNLKLLINSFGNNCRTYLYGKDKADIKYNLAIEILEKEGTWTNYKQTETYKKAIETFKLKEKEQKEQLLRVQSLERLQQLGQLQQLETFNKSYKDFSHLENTIIYLDPPYENTTGYHGETFEHKEFYNWAYEMSKKNIVLISSYEISDDRFECIYTFDKARSTMQSGINNKENKTERLFMVKKD
jgi:phage protein|nr:MAG TPA: DNA adenine methylase [Caudoviricetes sp.]